MCAIPPELPEQYPRCRADQRSPFARGTVVPFSSLSCFSIATVGVIGSLGARHRNDTFVSRMNLEQHPDQPEWLSHVNASVLKAKRATAIIGISSIHLRKTFINAEAFSEKVLIAQAGIHIAFLLSAMAIAMCDRLLVANGKHASQH